MAFTLLHKQNQISPPGRLKTACSVITLTSVIRCSSIFQPLPVLTHELVKALNTRPNTEAVACSKSSNAMSSARLQMYLC